MASFSYQLGPTGNRTNLQEVMPGATASRASAWGYDKLSRLTNELAAGSSPAGSLGYIYDDVGNGLSPQTTGLRIMDPTLQYPDGYGVYMNSATPTAQTVDPYTGKPIAFSNPNAHIPCN